MQRSSPVPPSPDPAAHEIQRPDSPVPPLPPAPANSVRVPTPKQSHGRNPTGGSPSRFQKRISTPPVAPTPSPPQEIPQQVVSETPAQQQQGQQRTEQEVLPRRKSTADQLQERERPAREVTTVSVAHA